MGGRDTRGAPIVDIEVSVVIGIACVVVAIGAIGALGESNCTVRVVCM